MNPEEPLSSPKEHILDSIMIQKWVNIPKCIMEAFQTLVIQSKNLEEKITNNRELQVVETKQVEVDLKMLAKHMEAANKDFLEQFNELKQTLNRTLKNMSVEISLANNFGSENAAKIKEQDQRMLRLEYENRDIKEKMGHYEDKSAFQKQLKSLGEEMQKKIENKEVQLRDHFSAKLSELVDIPSLVGPGRKFSNVKSLLQHLHDGFDKRLAAIKEIVDNKEAFFRNGLAEMDILNKIKALAQVDIKQSIMREVDIKFETFTKENKSDAENFIKKQLKDYKAPEAPKQENPDLIDELFTTIKDLQLRIYYLEHPEFAGGQRLPSVEYIDNMMSSAGDINSSQPKLFIDSIMQQQSKDVPGLNFEMNGRPRSKSDSKKKIRSESDDIKDSGSRRIHKDLGKDMDRVENSILEEDEEASPRAKFPSIRNIPGIPSHKISDADSSDRTNKGKLSAKDYIIMSQRRGAGKNAATSVASNHSSFSQTSSGFSPQQLGEKLSNSKLGKQSPASGMGRIKRSSTIGTHYAKTSAAKLNHSTSRDAEESSRSDNAGNVSFTQGSPMKRTEPDERMVTIGERTSTIGERTSTTGGGNSPREAQEKTTFKSEVFELNRFDLKNMEPHTVQFLNILEGEFESIRKLLGQLQTQAQAQSKPIDNNNKTITPKAPEITTRPRQGSFSGTTVGARINIGDKDSQSNTMNTSANISQPKKSAYQMLKTVAKMKEEEELANAQPQPQQSGPQKYPLTQIRANGGNGFKISEISSNANGGNASQNSAQGTKLPTIPIEAQNKLNSIPLTNTDRKEYTSEEVFKDNKETIEPKSSGFGKNTNNSGGKTNLNTSQISTHSDPNQTSKGFKTETKASEIGGEKLHQPQLKGQVGGSKSPEKRRRAVTNFGAH